MAYMRERREAHITFKHVRWATPSVERQFYSMDAVVMSFPPTPSCFSHGLG